MAKYRKKPVVIDAVQWTGQNVTEVKEFMKGVPWVLSDVIIINTLEGAMEASEGDYIIKGIKGEFYPCKPDIFELSYEKVTEETEMKEDSPTFYNNSKYMD